MSLSLLTPETRCQGARLEGQPQGKDECRPSNQNMCN